MATRAAIRLSIAALFAILVALSTGCFSYRALISVEPISSTLGAVAHDAAGNLTQLGARGYEYDVDGQLVRVREAGALRAHMLYDGTGRLVRLTDAASGEITYRIAPDFEWTPICSTARATAPSATTRVAA